MAESVATRPLTEIQLKVLRFCIRSHQLDGCSPTYSEIREGLGIGQGQVQACLNRLEGLALIHRPHPPRGKSRGRIITITATGYKRAEEG